jgi:hypothetical protein
MVERSGSTFAKTGKIPNGARTPAIIIVQNVKSKKKTCFAYVRAVGRMLWRSYNKSVSGIKIHKKIANRKRTIGTLRLTTHNK